MSRESPRSELWTVPNQLSFGRLGLAVLVFALIAFEFHFFALVLFVLAAITDALDGYLARKLNQSTAFGRQLDPLIDKIIVAGCFIQLLAIPGSGVMPWMVIVIVSRELIVQALRSLIEGQGHPFGAKMAGKLKTTAQFLAIVAILLSLEYDSISTLPILRDVLIWAAVGLTIYSGCVYVMSALPILAGQPMDSSES